MTRLVRRPERGASAVEFALVLPILLLLVFGIIQYGWYFYAMQTGTAAAGQTVRRLSVGDCQSGTARNAFLVDSLGAAASGPVTDSVRYTAAGSDATIAAPGVPGGGVVLTITFDTLDLNFPFIPVPDDGSVSREFYARVEDTNDSGGCS